MAFLAMSLPRAPAEKCSDQGALKPRHADRLSSFRKWCMHALSSESSFRSDQPAPIALRVYKLLATIVMCADGPDRAELETKLASPMETWRRVLDSIPTNSTMFYEYVEYLIKCNKMLDMMSSAMPATRAPLEHAGTKMFVRANKDMIRTILAHEARVLNRWCDFVETQLEAGGFPVPLRALQPLRCAQPDMLMADHPATMWMPPPPPPATPATPSDEASELFGLSEHRRVIKPPAGTTSRFFTAHDVKVSDHGAGAGAGAGAGVGAARQKTHAHGRRRYRVDVLVDGETQGMRDTLSARVKRLSKGKLEIGVVRQSNGALRRGLFAVKAIKRGTVLMDEGSLNWPLIITMPADGNMLQNALAQVSSIMMGCVVCSNIMREARTVDALYAAAGKNVNAMDVNGLLPGEEREDVLRALTPMGVFPTPGLPTDSEQLRREWWDAVQNAYQRKQTKRPPSSPVNPTEYLFSPDLDTFGALFANGVTAPLARAINACRTGCRLSAVRPPTTPADPFDVAQLMHSQHLHSVAHHTVACARLHALLACADALLRAGTAEPDKSSHQEGAATLAFLRAAPRNSPMWGPIRTTSHTPTYTFHSVFPALALVRHACGWSDRHRAGCNAFFARRVVHASRPALGSSPGLTEEQQGDMDRFVREDARETVLCPPATDEGKHESGDDDGSDGYHTDSTKEYVPASTGVGSDEMDVLGFKDIPGLEAPLRQTTSADGKAPVPTQRIMQTLTAKRSIAKYEEVCALRNYGIGLRSGEQHPDVFVDTTFGDDGCDCPFCLDERRQFSDRCERIDKRIAAVNEAYRDDMRHETEFEASRARAQKELFQRAMAELYVQLPAMEKHLPLSRAMRIMQRAPPRAAEKALYQWFLSDRKHVHVHRVDVASLRSMMHCMSPMLDIADQVECFLRMGNMTKWFNHFDELHRMRLHNHFTPNQMRDRLRKEIRAYRERNVGVSAGTPLKNGGARTKQATSAKASKKKKKKGKGKHKRKKGSKR